MEQSASSVGRQAIGVVFLAKNRKTMSLQLIMKFATLLKCYYYYREYDCRVLLSGTTSTVLHLY